MPAKKNKQLDSAGMVAALAPTTAENYLGDPKVVEWLIRNYGNTCATRWLSTPDVKEQRVAAAKLDVAEGAALADILLGKNPQFTPIANWNKAGVIDRWLVDEFHITGATAEERVINVVVTFILRLYTTITANEDQPDDVFQMLIDGLVQEFTWLIMGLPEWNKCD
jgi:hypothetical protein